jgi:hypothetical protein
MVRPWKSLFFSITNALSTLPIVQTRGKRLFKAPTEVRALVLSTLHLGQPILPDLADEQYIAHGYSEKHRERLKELGMPAISFSEMIDRLQADLVRLPSKTKTMAATDPWHEAFASMFLPLFESSTSPEITLQRRLQRLAVIPLIAPNQWAGAAGDSKSSKVYFAYTDKIPIPESISLKLLDKHASVNPTRKAFYKALGVEECPKELVFAEIKKLHRNPSHEAKEPELRYLFYFHENSSQLKDWLQIPAGGVSLSAKETSRSWYFPSQAEHDLYQLIPASKQKDIRDIAVFLSPALVEFVPSSVRVGKRTWNTWLKALTDAENRPRLTQCKGTSTSLSPEILAVLKYNPAKFLATLKAHWTSYQESVNLVREELGKCQVPCQDRTLASLSETYLPTSDIFDRLSGFNLPETTVDILQLPVSILTNATCQDWRFLELFGVRSQPDLHFFTKALSQLTNEETVFFDAVKQVYRGISDHVKAKDFDNIRYVTHADKRRPTIMILLMTE